MYLHFYLAVGRPIRQHACHNTYSCDVGNRFSVTSPDAIAAHRCNQHILNTHDDSQKRQLVQLAILIYLRESRMQVI